MTSVGEVAKPRRGRGSRAGIDRARILDAARQIAPEQLTMQAVANRLGVDRKALHHYVADREGLLRLVAATNFEQVFAAADRPDGDGWQELAAAHAAAVRAGMIATGALIDYFRFDPGPDHPAFASVEKLLESLLAVGFDDASAGRALVLITEIGMMSARDVLLQDQAGGHPQGPEVVRALGESPDGAYTALRRLAMSEPFVYDEDQFKFDVRVVLAGLERELHRS